MPNRRPKYADMGKYAATRKKQRQRYYNQTAIYEPSPWTTEQDELVLAHNIPDSNLSSQIGHSVRAIQNRRARLKKAIKDGEIK